MKITASSLLTFLLIMQPSLSFSGQKLHFLSEKEFKEIQILPPTPLGSKKDLDELKVLHQWEKKRTESECARAKADALPSDPPYSEFFGQIGPFSLPLQGEALELMTQLTDDANQVSGEFKKKFKWPRAYEVDKSLKPCVEKVGSPSYPSGHALISKLFALALADLDPNKRTLYLMRASEIGNDRVLAGLHRPSDIEAGRLLADQIYEAVQKSPKYKTKIQRIQKSLK